MKYYRSIALQEAGRADEAKALMDEVSEWNFNGVGFALIRNDVMERVGQS